jgi:hypothetical protein
VLKEAELVLEEAAGTRRIYRINQTGLARVRDYFDRFWMTALDNFAVVAEQEAASQRAKRGRGAARGE